MSIFDQAWASVVAATKATMGKAITVNGVDVVAEVSTITSTSRRLPGLRVTDNSLIVHLSREDFVNANVSKGVILLVDGKRSRVMSVADLGGAGWELTAESTDNMKVVPGL